MTNADNLAVSDEALVLQAQRDPQSQESRAAAAELLCRYRGRVYLWCFGVVREQEKALDLSQDVLLAAYRGLPSFAGRARFSSWLFTIARNRCLSELRKPALLRDEEVDPDMVSSRDVGPDQVLEQKLDEEDLLALIREHLDPLEQEAIWLRCIEGMPLEAMTRILNISGASGARGVLQRARRKLSSCLAASRSESLQRGRTKHD
jgi:RNA polymerase sigma-70 factor, ECF subfamily